MKDGRTHLAHKAEHGVDLQSGAVVAVTLQPANESDTSTLYEALAETKDNLAEVQNDPATAEAVEENVVQEVVADKGYHSNDTMRDLQECEIRSYVSEPKRKWQRHWEGKAGEQHAVYANRRRIKGERGKALLRKRGELLERSFGGRIVLHFLLPYCPNDNKIERVWHSLPAGIIQKWDPGRVSLPGQCGSCPLPRTVAALPYGSDERLL